MVLFVITYLNFNPAFFFINRRNCIIQQINQNSINLFGIKFKLW